MEFGGTHLTHLTLYLAMLNHIITRAANKNRHPGTPDLPTPQHSSQVIQEEHATQNAVCAAAILQQQENICQAAKIEDQLHEQIKTQHTNFQNTTSAVTRSLLKPQQMPKTAPDGAISSAQTWQHIPGHDEGDGES